MTWLKRAIPSSIEILSGSYPPNDQCFRSDHLQILCNSSDIPWTDDGKHAHEESDEVYMVLEEAITLQIEDESTVVSAGEICFVPLGIFHAVTHVDVPYRGFVIRAPSVQDKINPTKV